MGRGASLSTETQQTAPPCNPGGRYQAEDLEYLQPLFASGHGGGLLGFVPLPNLRDESGGIDMKGRCCRLGFVPLPNLPCAQLKASLRALSRCHPNPTIRKRPDRPVTKAIQYSLKCIKIELTPMTGSSSSRTAGRNRGWCSIT